MKKYRVGFWYTVYGVTQVKAENEEQAEKNLKLHLDTEGLEGLDYDTTDRDFEAQDAEVFG